MVDTLRNNAYVQELFEILQKNPNAEMHLREFSSLINSADTMQKQLNDVLGELNSVKKQLTEIKDKKNPIRATLDKMVKSLESKVVKLQAELDEVQKYIIDGAKKAISAFKEKSISALDFVLKILKVKVNLEDMKKDCSFFVERNNKIINGIEGLSGKYHEIGKHIKNIGKTLTGKEQITERRENGRLSKALQAPFKVANTINKHSEKEVSKILNKIENLENKAEKINELKGSTKENKPSILQKLNENKSNIADKITATVDKAKKQEVAL